MSARKGFTADEARRIGEQIGIDWSTSPFDVDQFRRGMDVELEHGLHDLDTNVTGDDPGHDREDRPRAPERVPRLLHAARADGGAGEARARLAEQRPRRPRGDDVLPRVQHDDPHRATRRR